jgi:hypothetical protein
MASTVIDVKKLASGIKVPNPCPRIILGLYPCRSASTKDLRVFTENGISSAYQLIKTRLRWHMQTPPQDLEYVVPNNEAVLFLKETIGYNKVDSQFDPLEVLLSAGIPKEKITLFVSMREPIATVTSWLEQFTISGIPQSELVKNAISAYKTIDKTVTKAHKEKIKVVISVYEALKDSSAQKVYQKIFKELNLPFSKKSIENWHLLPQLTNPDSGIFFPLEPEMYQSTSEHPIHYATEKSHGPKYKQKTSEHIDTVMTPKLIKILEDSPIFSLYNKFRTEAEKTLKITISKESELENYYKRHKMSHKS